MFSIGILPISTQIAVLKWQFNCPFLHYTAYCLLVLFVLSETFTKFLAEEPNSAAGGALYLSKFSK